MNLKRRIAAMEERDAGTTVSPPPAIWFRNGDTFTSPNGETVTAEALRTDVHTIIIEADE